MSREAEDIEFFKHTNVYYQLLRRRDRSLNRFEKRLMIALWAVPVCIGIAGGVSEMLSQQSGFEVVSVGFVIWLISAPLMMTIIDFLVLLPRATFSTGFEDILATPISTWVLHDDLRRWAEEMNVRHREPLTIQIICAALIFGLLNLPSTLFLIFPFGFIYVIWYLVWRFHLEIGLAAAMLPSHHHSYGMMGFNFLFMGILAIYGGGSLIALIIGLLLQSVDTYHSFPAWQFPVIYFIIAILVTVYAARRNYQWMSGRRRGLIS